MIDNNINNDSLSTTRHVAAARTEREKAAAQFPPAQRARRQAEALLQQNTEEMQKLQAGIPSHRHAAFMRFACPIVVWDVW